MSVSTVVVALNAQLLRSLDLRPSHAGQHANGNQDHRAKIADHDGSISQASFHQRDGTRDSQSARENGFVQNEGLAP